MSIPGNELLKKFFLHLILCGGGVAIAQSTVTFNLDLQPLIEQQLFVPSRGDRAFVRGDFNQWAGTDFELRRTPGYGLYTGTFLLEATRGDTLEYKYVIAREGERYFWEQKPGSHGTNGNRWIEIDGPVQELPVAHFHFDEYFSYPVIFSREKMETDFDSIRALLERIHPALYDYTPEDQMDAAFEKVAAQLDRPMEFREFYTLLSRLVAKIGCGHSSLWIQSDYWNTVPDSLFPIRLYLDEESVFVSGSYGEECEVPVGSRLLSINGIQVQEVIGQLKSITSADGFNMAYKLAMVEKNFSKKYALVYGFPGHFKLNVVVPGEDRSRLYTVHGVPAPEIDRQSSSESELSFRKVEGTHAGLLTINTFGYYDRVGMFKSFIDSVFREIKSNGMEELILDLRGNSGGDPFCASYLFSYLEHQPVPYFAAHYGQYDTLALPVPLAANHFDGELYILTDGRGFSTTGHFCALLKYHGLGTFIGGETGATYTCTGSVTYPTMEQTRIILGTARNRRYTVAVKNMDPGRGIIPDYPVRKTQEDLILGRDPVYEFALSLVADERGNPTD
jgi:hypothetical protein